MQYKIAIAHLGLHCQISKPFKPYPFRPQTATSSLAPYRSRNSDPIYIATHTTGASRKMETSSARGTEPGDHEEKSDNGNLEAQSGNSDGEDAVKSGKAEEEGEGSTWDWNTDPHNPYNWPSGKKAMQVGIISSIALLA